jgi:hypothetical protein
MSLPKISDASERGDSSGKGDFFSDEFPRLDAPHIQKDIWWRETCRGRSSHSSFAPELPKIADTFEQGNSSGKGDFFSDEFPRLDAPHIQKDI